MNSNCRVGGSCPVKPASSCCEQKENGLSPLIKRIRDVARVALALFAFYLQPTLFGAALTLGVGLGIAYTGYHLSLHQSGPLFGRAKPLCAQGYLEALSGMQFGEVVSELTTHAFIGAHIHCLPRFFIPFTGLAVGAYVGRLICEAR